MPRFCIFTLFIILLAASVVPDRAAGQDAGQYYAEGLAQKESGNLDAAAKAFENAMKKDRSFTDAYYERALLYQLEQKSGALKRACDLLLDAVRMAPDSAKFKYALGMVYKDREMPDDAAKMWERALQTDPDYVPALLAKSDWHADELEKNRHRVDYNFDQLRMIETGLLMDPFIQVRYPMFWDTNMVDYARNYTGTTIQKKDLAYVRDQISEIRFDEHNTREDSAIQALTGRTLELLPGSRRAAVPRVRGHFEMDEYDQMRDFLIGMLAGQPDYKDGRLFLGLAYQRLRDYDRAAEQFNRAKQLMENGERAVFENVGLLNIGGLELSEIRAGAGDTTGFWNRKDPLFLTGINERRLEHYSRVAEANLRYSIPEKEIEGWTTDRGRMLIKYGPPKDRKVYHGSDMALKMKYDFWYYDKFTFAFEARYFDLENKFRTALFNKLEFPRIARDVEKRYPDYYRYEPKGMLINFPYDVACFRGNDGKTRVEVYYAIPLDRIAEGTEGAERIGMLKTGLFLLDRDWNMVYSEVRPVTLTIEAGTTDSTAGREELYEQVYQLEPGSYNLGLEMIDLQADNAGTYRDSIEIERFGSDSLQVSGLQLARSISLIDSAGALSKDNLRIVPNPRRLYSSAEPICLYFELYNLAPDVSNRRRSFRAEYTIRRYDTKNPPGSKEEWSTTERFFRELFVNDIDQGVTNEYTYSGDKPDEYQFLRIEHSIDENGLYQLVLRITDVHAGTQAEKSVLFRFRDETGR